MSKLRIRFSSTQLTIVLGLLFCLGCGEDRKHVANKAIANPAPRFDREASQQRADNFEPPHHFWIHSTDLNTEGDPKLSLNVVVPRGSSQAQLRSWHAELLKNTNQNITRTMKFFEGKYADKKVVAVDQS